MVGEGGRDGSWGTEWEEQIVDIYVCMFRLGEAVCIHIFG